VLPPLLFNLLGSTRSFGRVDSLIELKIETRMFIIHHRIIKLYRSSYSHKVQMPLPNRLGNIYV